MSVKLSRRGSRVTIEGETTELAGRVLRRFHEQAVHRALTVDDIQLGLVEIGVGRQDETARGTGAGRHRAAVAGRRATASRCAPAAATCARAPRASATT